MENIAKKAELLFISHAKNKGYKHKVVGDISYTKTKSPTSKWIKLVSVKKGRLQISENGDKYEIEIPVCERCGSFDCELVVNPYVKELSGEESEEYLCDSCHSDILSDI